MSSNKEMKIIKTFLLAPSIIFSLFAPPSNALIADCETPKSLENQGFGVWKISDFPPLIWYNYR